MTKRKSQTDIDNIIIHSSGTGPDHQRLDRVLALKNIPWSFNRITHQTLAALPGGKEGLPILQFNRCFFVGSLVSMVALEQLKPEPTIFPNGNNGMPLALAWWSNEFFKAVKDNPNKDMLQKHCALISRQIADGRHFLQGRQPGLADIHSFAPLWALKNNDQNISILEDDILLGAWYQRVANIRGAGFQYITRNQNNLLLNMPETMINFPECDAISDKEIINWGKQGTLSLWRSSLSSGGQ